MNEMVGIERFAKICGWSVQHAQRKVRKGEAPRHYQIGRRVMFAEKDIYDWITAHVVNPENK